MSRSAISAGPPSRNRQRRSCAIGCMESTRVGRPGLAHLLRRQFEVRTGEQFHLGVIERLGHAAQGDGTGAGGLGPDGQRGGKIQLEGLHRVVQRALHAQAADAGFDPVDTGDQRDAERHGRLRTHLAGVAVRGPGPEEHQVDTVRACEGPQRGSSRSPAYPHRPGRGRSPARRRSTPMASASAMTTRPDGGPMERAVTLPPNWDLNCRADSIAGRSNGFSLTFSEVRAMRPRDALATTALMQTTMCGLMSCHPSGGSVQSRSAFHASCSTARAITILWISEVPS